MMKEVVKLVEALSLPMLKLQTLVWSLSSRRASDYPLAWYVVPLLVLLALGATVILGAMVFCMLRGMHLAVTVNLGGGKFLIGCA